MSTRVTHFHLFRPFRRERGRKRREYAAQDSSNGIQSSSSEQLSFQKLLCLPFLPLLFIRLIPVLCMLNSPTLSEEIKMSRPAIHLFKSSSESKLHPSIVAVQSVSIFTCLIPPLSPLYGHLLSIPESCSVGTGAQCISYILNS